MKKKTLMIILATVLTFVGINYVKADDYLIKYYYYSNGTMILWDNENEVRCDHVYGTCKEYIVSEDDGSNDSEIVLTHGDENINIQKRKLSGWYVLITSKKIDDYYLYGEQENRDPSELDGIIYTRFYDYYTDIEDRLTDGFWGSNNNVYIVSNPKSYFHVDEDITVKSNILIHASMLSAGNIINNGKIVAGAISTNEISGNGNITLDYSMIPYGPTAFEADYLSLRLDLKKITDVTVDLKGTQIKDGTEFGFVGFINHPYLENISKEKAQEIIDMLNDVKGDTIKGYKVVLKEFTDKPSGIKMYIGVLHDETKTERLESSVSNIKNTGIKKSDINPKTGDMLLTILCGLFLSISVFVVTIKVAKRR